jgi:GNAT superfamily N-acetyltransferase
MLFFFAIRNKLFKLATWKLFEAFYNVQYVFVFDLASAEQLRSDRQLPLGVTFRIFRRPRDFEFDEIYRLMVQAALPRRVVEERLARGDMLGVATASEELRAYTWATFGRARIAEARRFLVLLQDQAVQYDTLVMPSWRGRGLQYALTAHVLQHLAILGYRQTLAWVNACNVRSIRNQLSQGKRCIAIIQSSPIFGVARVQPLTPGADLTFEK